MDQEHRLYMPARESFVMHQPDVLLSSYNLIFSKEMSFCVGVR